MFLNSLTTFVIPFSFLLSGGDRCLTFAYHMYGKTIGSLKVLQETNMNTIEVFSKSGEQSNSYSDWKMASLDIYHHMNDTVSVERDFIILHVQCIHKFSV